MDENKFIQLCDNVAEEVSEKLEQISNELKVDKNTVWLTFKECLKDKETAVASKYNQSHKTL